jgi:hypothetical protein
MGQPIMEHVRGATCRVGVGAKYDPESFFRLNQNIRPLA